MNKKFDLYLKNKKLSLIHMYWKQLMDFDSAHNLIGIAKNS